MAFLLKGNAYLMDTTTLLLLLLLLLLLPLLPLLLLLLPGSCCASPGLLSTRALLRWLLKGRLKAAPRGAPTAVGRCFGVVLASLLGFSMLASPGLL